jgi:hypothetical protein
MNRLILVLVVCGLCSAGLMASTSAEPGRPVPATGEILRAHNVSQDGGALSAFTCEAVKLTSYYAGPGSESPSFFERRVSVSISGNAFRRHQTDPLGLRDRFDLFDGQALYHSELEMGRQVKETGPVVDTQLASVGFSIKTFGLVPILGQLSDPTVEAIYLGEASGGEDRIEMKTAYGSWVIFSDESHIIRRLEAGNKTIEYADYREVQGVRLPFIQRLYVAGQLFYELIFTGINLSPSFPPDYFSRDALPK